MLPCGRATLIPALKYKVVNVPVFTELRRLVALALPMILTQISQMGMGVADTMMAGRVSATDLAGVALGGNFYWPVMLFMTGVLMSLTPTVSQLDGAGRRGETGEVARQAMWLAVGGGLVAIVLLNHVEPLYRMIGVAEEAIPIATGYLHAMSWGLIPVLLYNAMRYLCDGSSWTVPAMVIAMGGLALKVPLNVLFIHGHAGLGIPAMGGVGCGWTTAMAMTAQMIAMAFVIGFSRMRSSGLYTRFSWPDPARIRRLIKLGVPIGASMFLEIAVFSAITLLIARLGVEAVAAHQIAMNIGGITFMVPLALGMAASVRVGFNVGAGDLPGARRSGWVAVGSSVVFAVLAAALVFALREFLVGLYTFDQAVTPIAVTLLLFVVFYQLFDDAQVTLIGALRGYKDTAMPMWIALFSYWIVGLPVGAWLGFGDLGVYGFWVGLVVGLGVAAISLLLRFRWLVGNPARVTQLAVR